MSLTAGTPRRTGWWIVAPAIAALALTACGRQPGSDETHIQPPSPAAETRPEPRPEPRVTEPPSPEPSLDVRMAQPGDACQILSPAEVEAIVGEAVQANLASKTGGTEVATTSQCDYAAINDPSIASVALRRPTDTDPAPLSGESVRRSLAESGMQVEDVPHLGESAFWAGNQLHVFLEDGRYLAVKAAEPNARERSTALARRALEHLGG